MPEHLRRPATMQRRWVRQSVSCHIEPENADSPDEVTLCKELTDIRKATPQFTEFRRCLMEAIWYWR